MFMVSHIPNSEEVGAQTDGKTDRDTHTNR